MGFGGFICRWICPCGFQNLSVLLGSGCWNVVVAVAVAVVAAVYVITAFHVAGGTIGPWKKRAGMVNEKEEEP